MLLEKRWQPPLVMMLGALVVLSFMGGILTALIVARLAKSYVSANTLQLIQLIISVLGFQGAGLIWTNEFLKMHEVSWGEGFGFARANYGRCLVIVLAALPVALAGEVGLGNLSLLVLDYLHKLFSWSWLKPQMQPVVEILQQQWPPHLIAVQGVVAIVLAPLGEEILFRGVLYTAIRQHGHRQLALWVSALLFAAVHFYLVGFLSLILLAALLVCVYELTKNLFAPILLHSLFNSVNFALIVTHPKWADTLFKT